MTHPRRLNHGGIDEVKRETDKETRAVDAMLCLRYQAGDRKAGDRMIRRHLGFAVKVSRIYAPAGILGEDDHLAAAMAGLQRACARFNPAMGYKFTTYAINWIRAVCARQTQESGRAIRTPSNSWPIYTMAKDKVSRLEPLTKRERQIYEGYESTQVDRFEDMQKGSGQHGASARYDAINQYQDPEADTERGNVERITAITISRTLAALTPKEREVLTRRFGLGTGREETLAEIGEDMQLSRERVRQLERAGLAKARRWADSRGLKADEVLNFA